VYELQTYELIRRAVTVNGKSIRQAAREFGLNRRTVQKMLKNPVPPGYTATEDRRKPKLGKFVERIEEIVRQDESAPRKQRHTAQRIYERLRDEWGYEGSYQQVRVYVARLKQSSKECFVPLVHAPGEGQADFFEAVCKIAGKKRKGHVFHMKLPFSGAWFARVYPGENAESFVDGNAGSFEFFGGVPRRIVYDNPGYAVKREPGGIKGRARRLVALFEELRSAFLFETDFAGPGKGNEKGSVERSVQTVRSRAFVPLPEADSFEELNEKLWSLAQAHKEKVPSLFEEESKAFLPLAQYKPSRLVQVKADKLALVRFDRCLYSVPFELSGRALTIRATPFKVEVLDARRVVAEHPRSPDSERVLTQLGHYIGLLELKPRAAKSALPVIQAGLPDEFEVYRRKVEDGTSHGDLLFVAVLRLTSLHGVETVARALRSASGKGIVDPAAIGLMCMKNEALPAKTAPALRSGLSAPSVKRPPLSHYGRLMAGVK
jgi:transposase